MYAPEIVRCFECLAIILFTQYVLVLRKTVKLN
nr:hypothetical protein CKEKCVAP_CKEKCVAP_CDS_0007 [Microvirus sp.]